MEREGERSGQVRGERERWREREMRRERRKEMGVKKRMCVGLQDAESLEGVLVERPFSAAADPLHTATVPRCVRVNRTVSRVQEVQVVTHQSAPVGRNNEEPTLVPRDKIVRFLSYLCWSRARLPLHAQSLSRPIREL